MEFFFEWSGWFLGSCDDTWTKVAEIIGIETVQALNIIGIACMHFFTCYHKNCVTLEYFLPIILNNSKQSQPLLRNRSWSFEGWCVINHHILHFIVGCTKKTCSKMFQVLYWCFMFFSGSRIIAVNDLSNMWLLSCLKIPGIHRPGPRWLGAVRI